MKKLIVMIVAVFVVTEVAAHHFFNVSNYTERLYWRQDQLSLLLRANSKTCFT